MDELDQLIGYITGQGPKPAGRPAPDEGCEPRDTPAGDGSRPDPNPSR